MTCLALQYFSTLSHKQHDFQKNQILQKSIQWEPCGQTDTMKPIITFHSFVNMPENDYRNCKSAELTILELMTEMRSGAWYTIPAMM